MIFSDGITDSARKASIWNGAGKVTPSSCGGRVDRAARLEHLVQRPVGEEAGDGQRQLGADALLLDDDDSAAELAQPPDGARHRAVVDADDDDVVRVVRERRAERAALDAEAADEPEADPAGAEVPLEHGDLRQVARGVGDRVAVLDGQLVLERGGDDLVGDQPDHARLPALPRHAEVVRRDGLTWIVRFTQSGTWTSGISATGRPRFRTSSGTNDSRSGRRSMSAW